MFSRYKQVEHMRTGVKALCFRYAGATLGRLMFSRDKQVEHMRTGVRAPCFRYAGATLGRLILIVFGF